MDFERSRCSVLRLDKQVLTFDASLPIRLDGSGTVAFLRLVLAVFFASTVFVFFVSTFFRPFVRRALKSSHKHNIVDA